MIKNGAKKVIKNPYVFSIVSKFCIVFLGFAYTVCQSRYLGASLKGDIAYISSITSITSIVFGFGVHQSYPYFKKKTGKDVSPVFMKLSTTMLGLYFIIAVLLTIVFKTDLKTGAVFLLTPCLVYNKIVAYISMVESPNRKNATEMFANLFEVIVVIGCWLFVPPKFIAGIFILIIKDIFLAIIYTYDFRKSLFSSDKLTFGQIAEILKFGIFPMLVLLMTTLNYRIDVIMLKQYVTSAEVGIYSVGVMLAERVWIIPDALKEVMISNLTKGKGIDEVSFVIRICNTACLIVVLGIVILGQPFINLFFGREYSSAYMVTVVILIGVVFMVYYKMIAAYNIVQGKQKENFVYLVISVLGNVIANIVLIPICGNLGAAIASIFSYFISAFLFIRRFAKDNNVKIAEMLVINKNDIGNLKEILINKK